MQHMLENPSSLACESITFDLGFFICKTGMVFHALVCG
jgi:hypothetical protein